jgi:hypothetical protein
MTLRSTGGATLANQIVECECGVPRRTLGRIVEAEPDGSRTHLSNSLERGAQYLCRGVYPQHGTTDPQGCSRPIRGSLRSASNVYFGVVRSAIYLPRTTEIVPEELLSILDNPAVRKLIGLLVQTGESIEPSLLRENQRESLEPFSDAQIEEAVKELTTADLKPDSGEEFSVDESQEVAFRRDEHRVLRSGMREDQLSVRIAPLDEYDDALTPFLETVLLIDRLRETRVLTGFNRIYPERGADDEDRLKQLWRTAPEPHYRWLPAYRVFGEGIFIELNLDRLSAWEVGGAPAARARSVEHRYGAARQDRHLRDRNLSPRFLLVHTFAHLLINQLTFECGYSTAALRERLYISDSDIAPMAGVLIYTATGDSEGTMGGLVRMGKPGYLEPAILVALEEAKWCSADPVCMESGTNWGQGPDSCNLAACHNCALVPETACEEFNRFLDRGVVVGTIEDRRAGFFS